VKVLVTGAAGFIGSHLTVALTRRGHEVFSVDKRWGSPTTDLPQLVRQVDRCRPDVIAHLGASCSTSVSLREPAVDFTDNVVGTFNVAEAVRWAGGGSVVFMSSVKVQSGHDGLVAPLGLSKRIGEDYLRMYGDLYGLPFVINRPSTVYGPGQDGSAEAGWVSWFARAALDGAEVVVNGDGSQSRDILYIDDMVALLVDQVEHVDAYVGGTYPVGGGEANEVSLTALLAELGHSAVTHGPRLPGDLQRVVTDNTAVSAVRGWQPTVGWRDGLARTLDALNAAAVPTP
jgi:nucleoside-diphosphate-sugar epimerase